jgi:glucose-6-phosphate isomerase
LIVRHAIENCFADAIGKTGLAAAAFDGLLSATPEAIETLRGAHAGNSLPLLRLPERDDDLADVADIAARYRESFDDVIVLGTGGSSLGGQTLCALGAPIPGQVHPRVHFLDNIDPPTFEDRFAAIDPARAGVIAISKSGGTAETLTQFGICWTHWRDVLGDGAGRHFTAITEPGDRPLRRLAEKFSIETIDHDPGIGGRYSALSVVGLLPAMIAGLDAKAVRGGAAAALAPVLAGAAPRDVPAAVGAAINVGLARSNGVGMAVMMPYIDRLADFGLWFRQLWAESLGKDGQGTTPIRAVGTVDQHSQLQLYLDGPRDKLFTLIFSEAAGTGGVVPADITGDPDLGYLAGRSMGDLLDAEQRATAETLAQRGCPTRILHLAAVDEAAMGELMMHFMLETMIAAGLMGVDPFDQPAVEQGKVLARQYLDAATRAGTPI